MAKRRDREASLPVRGILDERRRLIAAGSLSAAVTVVLVLGAILRTDAPFAETTVPFAEPTPTAGVTGKPAAANGGPIATPAPVARPTAEAAAETPPSHRTPTDGTLGERAAADRERLADSGASYTVQLMVSCDPDNARRVLRMIGEDSRLYVLPIELDGNACYRMCWGSYPSRAKAENAADLPAAFDSPRVRAVEELTS
jgi:septal ring-binding cell division protein DamX